MKDSNKNGIHERLEKVLNYYFDGKQSALVKLTGLSRSTISRMFILHTEPPFSVIFELLDHCEFLNPQWLILGVGDMQIYPSSKKVEADNQNDYYLRLLEIKQKRIDDLEKQLAISMQKQYKD